MNWHPASWLSRPATQQPKYSDPVALERAVGALSRLPRLTPAGFNPSRNVPTRAA